MKRYVLLLTLLAFLLTACDSGGPLSDSQPPTVIPVPSTSAAAATEPTEPSTQLPTEPSTTAPTDATVDPLQAELDSLSALFGDVAGWYNAAAGQCYEGPNQLILRKFFCCGFSDVSSKLTDAEREALEGRPGMNPNLSVRILPAERMNQVLELYFGLSLADLDAGSFEGLEYLESTDCYYFTSGDVDGLAFGFRAIHMETLESGTVLLHYTCEGKDAVYEIGLKPRENGYQILFNRQVEEWGN